MNFYTTYSACLKSQGTVGSVFFKIVKTPVNDLLLLRALRLKSFEEAQSSLKSTLIGITYF